MYTTKLTMEERLLAAHVAISNALGDETIMERLSFLGYDENRLKAGLVQIWCQVNYFRLSRLFARRAPSQHSNIPTFHYSHCERSEPKFVV